VEDAVSEGYFDTFFIFGNEIVLRPSIGAA